MVKENFNDIEQNKKVSNKPSQHKSSKIRINSKNNCSIQWRRDLRKTWELYSGVGNKYTNRQKNWKDKWNVSDYHYTKRTHTWGKRTVQGEVDGILTKSTTIEKKQTVFSTSKKVSPSNSRFHNAKNWNRTDFQGKRPRKWRQRNYYQQKTKLTQKELLSR